MKNIHFVKINPQSGIIRNRRWPRIINAAYERAMWQIEKKTIEGQKKTWRFIVSRSRR